MIVYKINIQLFEGSLKISKLEQSKVFQKGSFCFKKSFSKNSWAYTLIESDWD